ncbi:Mycosubtilin synthase subunit C (fragment) [Tenacibaculum xiamenense]
MVDLFSAQVLETPDSIAVVYSDESLSYSELDKRSNQLAHYLQGQGVKPDDLVGICLDRGLDMIVGLLGILKSGGAYVPIAPDYPQDRIDYIVEDTGIELLLTSGEGCFVKEGVSLLNLESDRELLSTYSSSDLEPMLKPDNLAYVIYTSGSTGKPKGVMIEHRSIVNRLLWMQLNYQLGSEDAILQKTPFNFDVSVWEFFWPLFNGAKLVVAEPEKHKETSYLKKIIQKQNVTIIHFVPSMLGIFLEETELEDYHNLRHVLCSGEELLPDHVRLFKDKLKNQKLDNLYGPTEGAIDVSFWEVPLDDLNKKVLIGKPISNIQIYITDSNLNLQPMGVIGELCIGGIGVARGYLNRSELTTDKFVPNPFKEGERIYKTGDLARWLPDGNVEFLGRKDNQVKIRGHRIELGEIENILSESPIVEKCCVVAKEDNSGSKYLVGYVVLAGDLDREELNEFLKERLPNYMIPSLWEVLEAMPITTNGKLDRNYLEKLKDSFKSLQEYVAPRSDVEESLVVIWQDLLGVERVGIYDNFFELGGHSLMVTQLVSKIRKEFEVEISVREIFQFTCIDELSSYICYKVINYNESLIEETNVDINI